MERPTEGVSPKVDDWIGWIEEVTFDTRLVPLSRSDIKVLLLEDKEESYEKVLCFFHLNLFFHNQVYCSSMNLFIPLTIQ